MEQSTVTQPGKQPVVIQTVDNFSATGQHCKKGMEEYVISK